MPILHFQHEQDKATLRASEVKPRLDRYIIEKNGGYRNIPQEWKLVSPEGEALRYKMKISVDEATILQNPKNWGSFFGNQGDNWDKYQIVFSKNPVRLDIIAWSGSLEKEICKHICGFFNENTFGARQSKGFGFFYPVKKSPAFQNNQEYLKPPSHEFWFDVSTFSEFDTEMDRTKKVTNLIDLFYKSLRSGLNILKRNEPPTLKPIPGKNYPLSVTNSEFYCKPALFHFLKEKGKHWDKRRFKELFLNDDYFERNANKKEKENYGDTYPKLENVYVRGLKKQIENYEAPDILMPPENPDNDNTNFLWRDLFGLSDSQQWISYGKELSKTHIQPNPVEIQRFQSPIRFFPYFSENFSNCTVYIHLKEIPEYYRKAKFNVSMTKTRTPPQEFSMGNIDLKEFFHWIIKNSAGNSLLNEMVKDENYKNHPNFSKLSQVFENLKGSEIIT
jgi:hypothetical protein